MNLKNQYQFIIYLACFSLLLTGCSISYSLEESSDSVSTSLDSLTSISTSSSGGEEKTVNATGTVYEEDVAAVTVLYVSRDKATDEYQRQVTNVAKTHGISDWEQDRSTFIGMGKGLRRAGVSKNAISSLPYFKDMADNSKYSDVLKGYRM